MLPSSQACTLNARKLEYIPVVLNVKHTVSVRAWAGVTYPVFFSSSHGRPHREGFCQMMAALQTAFFVHEVLVTANVQQMVQLQAHFEMPEKHLTVLDVCRAIVRKISAVPCSIIYSTVTQGSSRGEASELGCFGRFCREDSLSLFYIHKTTLRDSEQQAGHTASIFQDGLYGLTPGNVLT